MWIENESRGFDPLLLEVVAGCILIRVDLSSWIRLRAAVSQET